MRALRKNPKLLASAALNRCQEGRPYYDGMTYQAPMPWPSAGRRFEIRRAVQAALLQERRPRRAQAYR